MNKLKIFSLSLVVVASSFFLSACSKKTTTTTNNANNGTKSAPKELVLSESEKPIVSLIPREDGHELKLKIDNIPSSISQIEYELIYSSTENGLTMEKGVGDTVKISSKNIEKDLLLGTASCTNGCKYKYDEGVSEGTLTLNFYTNDNQTATYETPFILRTSANIKKDGGFTLKNDGLSVKATTTTKSDYFVVIKNYPSYYSVFSNGKGAGKITSITPTTVTKQDTASLVGNYTTN